jgi:glutathione S-transferase
MSELRLWGQPRSINVQKVLWSLEELGLPFERVDAGSTFGRVRDADYLALNPNGLVPTLVDGGTPIWESNAIVRYLFARYGKAPTHPTDPLVRAHADSWTDWKSSTLWPHVRTLVVQLIRTPADKRDHGAIEAAHGQVAAALKVLDAQLSKTPFVAGSDFTWGDIPVASAAQRWFNLPGVSRGGFKSVEAWYARVAERPGFKRWLDIPLT